MILQNTGNKKRVMHMNDKPLHKKFTKVVGNEIRLIRMEKSMSIEDLAHRSKLHYSTVSDLENGKTNTFPCLWQYKNGTFGN